MERALHRFVRLLRAYGVRVSTPEVADAFAGLTAVRLLDRDTVRGALAATLVKDRRDVQTFGRVFEAFFALEDLAPPEPAGHEHGHDQLADEGAPTALTVSEQPSEIPAEGHDHDAPVNIRDFFDEQDLAQQYNLHQEANKIDLSALSDELVFGQGRDALERALGQLRVELATSRLTGAADPGQLSDQVGGGVDLELSVAESAVLAAWLEHADLAPELVELLRQRLAGVVEDLPELLKRHLQRLLELERANVEERARLHPAWVDAVPESERRQMEEALRRLTRHLRGALTHRKATSTRGRVNVARTMRANMRYDGIPFRPITWARREDRPRLVVLADVSLSVRRASRFTLHLVHGLQSMFSQVRSFAFVGDLVEITDLFEQHPLEHALGLVFGGDVLDVDANSDYGRALGAFLEDFGNAVNRRTTVLVLGDGRGNANPPNVEALQTIRRRCRQLIWMTPEPRYSWVLGSCDMPLYEEVCDRVEVIRDVAGLDALATELASGPVGAGAAGGR